MAMGIRSQQQPCPNCRGRIALQIELLEKISSLSFFSENIVREGEVMHGDELGEVGEGSVYVQEKPGHMTLPHDTVTPSLHSRCYIGVTVGGSYIGAW